MDKTLELKLEEFKKAINALQKALKQKGQNDIMRDCIIKRFEFTFELAWKTSKILLSNKFGKDIFSPKECFRELRRNKLISDEETEIMLKMTDDRNAIIHIYSESFSDEVFNKIKNKYFKLLKKVYKAIESEL